MKKIWKKFSNNDPLTLIVEFKYGSRLELKLKNYKEAVDKINDITYHDNNPIFWEVRFDDCPPLRYDQEMRWEIGES